MFTLENIIDSKVGREFNHYGLKVHIGFLYDLWNF